jgi:FKBP-type peptidyl-prolyl cis-trans isomerase FklB
MKFYYVSLILIGSFFFSISCSQESGKSEKVQKLSSEIDSISYIMGSLYGKDVAKNLESRGYDTLISKDIFLRGFQDNYNGEPKIPDEVAQTKINDFFQKQKEQKYADYKLSGEQWMEQNKEKEGVKVLPSGLQYKVLQEGDGPKPEETDKVRVHYHGTKIDGSVFDSSVDRGEPAEFPVRGVIPGWTEALQLMPVGSKWKIFIPWELGYGERGQGRKIPPYTVLIFEVELLDIVE